MLESQKPARTPRLHRGARRGRQQRRPLGKPDDAVLVGDDDGQAGAVPSGNAGANRGAHGLVEDLGEDGVLPGRLGQLQLDDAALASVRGGDRGGTAQRFGRDLGAQADGHRRHALVHDVSQQGAQVHQPGVLGVVVRAHGPAQNDEPAADLGQVGDRVPGPGPHHSQGDALGEEPLAQGAQGGEGLGLDHSDDRCGCSGRCRERRGRCGLPSLPGPGSPAGRHHRG